MGSTIASARLTRPAALKGELRADEEGMGAPAVRGRRARAMVAMIFVKEGILVVSGRVGVSRTWLVAIEVDEGMWVG